MKPTFDLSVYLITDPVLNGGRPVEDVVARAVAGGVTMVQLRDPVSPTRKLVELARRLKALLAPLSIPLVVNDRVDVALAAGADGVHLGQKDMEAVDARLLMGRDFIIGLSVGSSAELAASRDAIGSVDYIGVGPVFATATKPDAGAAIGIEGLAAMCTVLPLPVVAIGGIDTSRAGAAIGAGAEGVAVVSAIMAAAEPLHATRAIAAEIARARRRQ